MVTSTVTAVAGATLSSPAVPLSPLGALGERLAALERAHDYPTMVSMVFPAYDPLFDDPLTLGDPEALRVMDFATLALMGLERWLECQAVTRRFLVATKVLERHHVSNEAYNVVLACGTAVATLNYDNPQYGVVFRWLVDECILTEGEKNEHTFRAMFYLTEYNNLRDSFSMSTLAAAERFVELTRDQPESKAYFRAIDARGSVHYTHEEWALAAQCFAKALELEATYHHGANDSWRFTTRAALGRALMNSGDHAGALRELRDAWSGLVHAPYVDLSWELSIPRWIEALSAAVAEPPAETLTSRLAEAFVV